MGLDGLEDVALTKTDHLWLSMQRPSRIICPSLCSMKKIILASPGISAVVMQNPSARHPSKHGMLFNQPYLRMSSPLCIVINCSLETLSTDFDEFDVDHQQDN